MTSVLIRGGEVVDANGVRSAHILIRDSVVAEILAPGTPASADQTIDATGLHVLPGVVDGHVHFNEPGRTDWEGFETGSRAAAAGGTTTVCDMPLNCSPPTVNPDALARKIDALKERSLVDYALWGGAVPGSLHHLGALREGGVVGVKGFLCDSGLAEFPHLSDTDLADAIARCADLGLLLALHAEDPLETSERTHAAQAKGKLGALDWAHSRPPSTELTAVRRALELTARTPARVHFVHISTAAAAREIGHARAAGMDVSVETCPHYLALDESDLEEAGAFGKCAPPLRARSEVDALWTALRDGCIDYVASDHSPCPPTMKTMDNIWTAWGGLGGVQSLLATLLSEGYHERGLDLPTIVRLTSLASSQRLGLHPRKGALQVGSDADLALVALDAEWTPRSDDVQTRWQLDPFVGRPRRGRVVSTLVRGTVVWNSGMAQVQPGAGELVRA
ncbi:MAG: allantoinase [Chloroflexota bacterium]